MPSWIVTEPVRYTDADGLLTAEAVSGSDFWRKTHYGFIHDNGHIYAEPVTGDFIAQVTFAGNYKHEYDHAGLMVWADETTWVKTGIEFTEGRYYASAVVTRDFSDWSTAPLPDDFTGGKFTIKLERVRESVEIRYRLTDSDPWLLLRIGALSENPTLQVGRLLSAPSGAGFVAEFTDFSIKPLEPTTNHKDHAG